MTTRELWLERALRVAIVVVAAMYGAAERNPSALILLGLVTLSRRGPGYGVTSGVFSGLALTAWEVLIQDRSLDLMLAGGYLVFFVALGALLGMAAQRASHAAIHDPLTGLPNRSAFQAEVQRLLTFSLKKRRSLSMAVLDVDHFKAINDTRGYQVGDRVITAVGECLARTVRPPFLAFRVGGDEFYMLFPGAGPGEAMAAAEDVRTACGSLVVPLGEGEQAARITVSVGVTTWDGTGDARDLRAACDQALRQAKGKRNAVVLDCRPVVAMAVPSHILWPSRKSRRGRR